MQWQRWLVGGCRSGRGGCSSLGSPAPAPAVPWGCGQVPLRGLQSSDQRGPGTGEQAEPPQSSRQGSLKTNSPVTGNKGGLVWFEPSWTLHVPVACLWQRHCGVLESPVLQGPPGAPEPPVSWCRAAPSTLLGSLLRMDPSWAGIVAACYQHRENCFPLALQQLWWLCHMKAMMRRNCCSWMGGGEITL